MGLRDCQRSFGASQGTQESVDFGVFQPQNPENLFQQWRYEARILANSSIVKHVFIDFHGLLNSSGPCGMASSLRTSIDLQAKHFLGEAAFLFEVPNQPR
jgi:hypothetical protein